MGREGCLLNRRCVTAHSSAPLRTTVPACNINKRPKICHPTAAPGVYETTTKSPKHLRPSTFETNLTNMHARHTPHRESADQPISRAGRGTDHYLCPTTLARHGEKTRTLLRGVLYGVGQRATTGPVPGLAVRGRRSLSLSRRRPGSFCPIVSNNEDPGPQLSADNAGADDRHDTMPPTPA